MCVCALLIAVANRNSDEGGNEGGNSGGNSEGKIHPIATCFQKPLVLMTALLEIFVVQYACAALSSENTGHLLGH